MAIQKSVNKITIPITIDRLSIDDTDDIVELDKKCFPTPWSASAYLTEVHNSSAYYIVAKTDGRIVGYAGMWLIMDEAHITTIGVDPDYRGKKVGERMLIDMLRAAVQNGAARATLEVRKQNLAAQNLYLKYGFEIVAIRRGYYTDNNEDAFVMWTKDMQQPEYRRVFNMNVKQIEERL